MIKKLFLNNTVFYYHTKIILEYKQKTHSWAILIQTNDY